MKRIDWVIRTSANELLVIDLPCELLIGRILFAFQELVLKRRGGGVFLRRSKSYVLCGA